MMEEALPFIKDTDAMVTRGLLCTLPSPKKNQKTNQVVV